MPAACTLLLLLGLFPPAGSLPLASSRRLPPHPSSPSRNLLGRPCSPPAAGHAGNPGECPAPLWGWGWDSVSVGWRGCGVSRREGPTPRGPRGVGPSRRETPQPRFAEHPGITVKCSPPKNPSQWVKVWDGNRGWGNCKHRCSCMDQLKAAEALLCAASAQQLQVLVNHVSPIQEEWGMHHRTAGWAGAEMRADGFHVLCKVQAQPGERNIGKKPGEVGSKKAAQGHQQWACPEKLISFSAICVRPSVLSPRLLCQLPPFFAASPVGALEISWVLDVVTVTPGPEELGEGAGRARENHLEGGEKKLLAVEVVDKNPLKTDMQQIRMRTRRLLTCGMRVPAILWPPRMVCTMQTEILIILSCKLLARLEIVRCWHTVPIDTKIGCDPALTPCESSGRTWLVPWKKEVRCHPEHCHRHFRQQIGVVSSRKCDLDHHPFTADGGRECTRGTFLKQYYQRVYAQLTHLNKLRTCYACEEKVTLSLDLSALQSQKRIERTPGWICRVNNQTSNQQCFTFKPVAFTQGSQMKQSQLLGHSEHGLLCEKLLATGIRTAKNGLGGYNYGLGIGLQMSIVSILCSFTSPHPNGDNKQLVTWDRRWLTVGCRQQRLRDFNIRYAKTSITLECFSTWMASVIHTIFIESSHQARRSLDAEISTFGSLMDSVELVTMLAGSRERASLPAGHSAVPAANGAMGHVGPPASSREVTVPGAGPPDSPSAETATRLLARSHLPAAGSHHHAVGRQERGKRALAFPSTPAAIEGTPLVLEAIGTDSTERTLDGHHGAWDVDNMTSMVLLPSSMETHVPGTGSPSRPASSWLGTEPPGSLTGTAAASPSPAGSSGETLWPLPSTSFPGSPAQPQYSPRATSSQTGANHIMLRSRDVTGDSTSPLLTALPATDSTFGAAGSSSAAAENPRSGTQRAVPGSAVQPSASAPSSVAPVWGHFPRPSTEHRLTPSRLAPESTATAAGRSYHPSSVLATERRVSDFPTTSTSVSTTATKGGGRTLRSLPASTRMTDAAEISTSGTEITSSSDQTRSPGMSLGAQGGGDRGATDPLLTGSPSASESTSTTFSSNYKPKSIAAAEEVTLHLDTHGADMPSVASGALGSPANSRTAGVTLGSATSTDLTSSLGRTFSSSGAGTHHPNSSREATDLPVPPGEPLLTSSLSASESTFRGVRSSHRPVNSSGTEKSPLASSPTSAFISATATSSSGRPQRSATGSGRWAAEVSTSSSAMYKTSGTIQSSSTSSVRETDGGRGSRGITDFTEQVADPSLTGSYSHSEGPSPATGSSHVSFSILSTERRTDFPTTSTSISTTATKDGGRALRSLPASTRLVQTTEISTTDTETISSSDHTQSSLGAQGGSGRGATGSSMDPLLTDSSSASESASPAEGTLTTGRRLPDGPLTSMPSSVMATSSEERSTVPVSDTHAASSTAGSSTPASPHTRSLDVVLLPSSAAAEPGRQSDVSQSSAGLGEPATKPLPAFPPGTSVPSPSPSFSHEEGTAWAADDHGMWSTVAANPTSHPDTARGLHTDPLPSSTAWPGEGHVSSGRAGYPEPEVTLSSKVSTYFSAGSEPSTMGSSHHSLSSSSAEERTSSSITDPAYSSSTSTDDVERVHHLVTNSTLAGGSESSASYAETASSLGSVKPASVEQSGTANTSTSSGGFVGFATETVFAHSSKIPTSSFQNDLTSFSSSYQPVSSIDAEKRTSVSHTDGTYISTTYTRGGERTLLSISNSSTSADSSESSTFFSEISNPSDSLKPSVAQDRRSNVSSDGSFVEPSTEPLLVHSSKLTSASAVSIQNTTLFNTDSELLTTGRSSLSSSAFPASSSAPLPHHSLSSTPPPTYLFTSSESSEPLSTSVVASSPPLQALSSSLPTSSLLSPAYSLASLLPLFSSPSSVLQSNDSDQASTSVATAVVRRVPSTATVARSSPRGTDKHNVVHQPQTSPIFTSTGSPLPTVPMEQLGGRIMSVPMTVTETASLRATTTQRGSIGQGTPLLTTTGGAPQAGPTDAPFSPSPSATKHSIIVPAVTLTTVKPPVLTTTASHQPTPGDASTTKSHKAQTPAATKHVYTTGESTEAVDPTTARPGKVTEENISVTSPSEAPPTSKTTVSIATTLAATKPTTVPPLSSTTRLRTLSPATDVDKCLSNPCPALATCNNTHGSYICQCPLGYELEKGKCNLVRIFIGQVPLKLNITHGKYTELFHIEGEILAMLNASLSGLPGYHHSMVKATREANFVHVSVQSTFSLASNVTFYDVVSSVKSYIRACKSPTEACQFISSLKPLHRVGSLCKQKDPECDKETSECTDFDGVALCQCKSGYFKYNKMDHSCRACEDGYKLENETCVSCPFGLGGFNCGNPYQLITVVIAAAGGGLLLIMGIALIVTCCRKNKNDISKLIFKSGDFQMSPYAEYPKNPRAQEWGRETIEMQENGSTKNLLQMTDVYYSPTGLRNPELERNGLYPPYTGLPGSRHSCIYPGQYNPSFISDETRRRDYF
ncbi:LOW QUALITY PROTEIN: uncharacterized protein O3Q21_002773 [Podargus strigoides]